MAFVAATAISAAQAQSNTSAGNSTASPSITFPPKSDCDFLRGDAKTRCDDRRAGKEVALTPQTGNETTPIATMPSSGGVYTPLSGGGSLSGLSSMSTLAPDANRPNLNRPMPSPNSIGNPWAGTPFANGTGKMPR
jgi:hypothetical protein